MPNEEMYCFDYDCRHHEVLEDVDADKIMETTQDQAVLSHLTAIIRNSMKPAISSMCYMITCDHSRIKLKL